LSVFVFARNDELSTSCKYELGRISRYVEQQSCSVNADRNDSIESNQINVNCTVSPFSICFYCAVSY